MRQPFIDYIKFVAITLVLLYHSGFDSYTYIKPMLGMCVPLFFISSGYLRSGKQYTIQRTLTQIAKIWFLIFFWGAVTCVFTYWVKGEELSPGKLWLDVVGLRVGYCNHLWYLSTFAILLLIHYFMQNLSKSQLWWAMIFVFLFSFVFVMRSKAFNNPLTGWCSYSLGYYLAGMLIPLMLEEGTPTENKMNRFVQNKLWLIVLLVVCYICQLAINRVANTESLLAYLLNVSSTSDVVFRSYSSVAVFCMTGITFLLFKHMKPRCNAVIEFISTHVMSIYLLHLFAIKALQLYCDNALINFALCYPITLVTVYLVSKCKPLRFLVKI